jgi:hypothetical protein
MQITEADYAQARLLVASHSGVINGLVRRIAQLQGRPILAEHIARLGWEVVLYRAMRADAQATIAQWRAQRLAAKAAATVVPELPRQPRDQRHRTAAKRAWRHARKRELEAAISA